MVWLADETGVNPVHAFTLLNLILLGLALRLALPRIGLPGCLLLFGGPIVWWIDKAHTEVFTFSLLTVAMLVLRERPWWSMVALGAAATQDPPIAAAIVLVAVGEVVARRPTWPDGKFWAGLIAGRGPGMPMWPIPCPPAAMPSRCISPLTFCYANLVGQGYSFVVASGRYDPNKLRLRPAWPVQSEAYVQTVFSELDWRTLTFATSSPEVIRGVRQVGRVSTWLAPDRLLMVLETTGASPSITLRPDLPMTGRLLDVTAQRTVRELDTRGAVGPDRVIPLPPMTDTLLLTLRIR